jgi:quercetin dioxygenase-like cupin family protein
MKGASMDRSVFEAELKADGYTQIEAKALDPRPANAEHAHDYNIRGLVLGGTFVVRQDNRPTTYRAGEVFAVPAGQKHSEEIGSEGARVLVGRKY